MDDDDDDDTISYDTRTCSVSFIGSSRCGNAGNTSYTELKMEMFGLGSQGQGCIVFDMS